MLLYSTGVMYGPVQSRRLGWSLGVNILPGHLKICNFNCAYCQCGWTHLSDRACPEEAWPDPEAVADETRSTLRTLRRSRRSIDRLTIAGEGEPTLHPRFADIIELLRRARDEEAPGVPIAILSNASTLGSPDVRRGLAGVDERYMKLDAGDEPMLRRLNGFTGSRDALVQDLASMRGIVIQTMFVDDRLGRFVNTREASVAAWIEALDAIRPAGVHLYTIDRAPAMPTLKSVDAAVLEGIAARVRAAGIPARAF